MDEKLEEIEKQYNEVPIPKELDFVVENALEQGKKKRKTEHHYGYLDLQRQQCFLQLV